MDDPAARERKQIRKESTEIKRSARAVERSATELSDSADRRTILAGDRTLQWVGKLTGTVLIVFAGFCLVAAVWRELRGAPVSPHPDIKPIPAALLVPMNFFLLLVAFAALVGIWLA
jgi:putative membrane protein